MSIGLSHARTIPAADLTTPQTGIYKIYADYWWSTVRDEAGELLLLFYRGSPQCNRDEETVRRLTADLWPGAEAVQVPAVYIKHTCAY
ncbi:hypothetical protein [Parafrankia sp. EUN1f]|uniref:hypothetical protein n=1 Tax=Parafrankia sp. EUN1f TaxID=102897 RepID=UPI0001C46D23|nr:hypothetical protein [Parafrankia sp. EUN1f]EFC80081.1 hypothetical protein FrEUN1fDRAFT_6808 [Parafrankia sp. EUN1f]